MSTKKKASTGISKAVAAPEAKFRAEPAPVEDKPAEKPMPEAEPEKEAPVASICDTCSDAYPHCKGGAAPGFTSEKGTIIACSKYHRAV